MEDAAKRARAERTCAKRDFYSILKTIVEALKDESPCELVNSRFSELKAARKDFLLKHREYTIATMPDNPESDDDSEDAYLKVPESKFRELEKDVFEYGQRFSELQEQSTVKQVQVKQEVAHAAAQEEGARTIRNMKNILDMEYASLVLEMDRAVLLKDKDVGLSSINNVELEMRSQFSRVNAANVKLVEHLCQDDADKEVKMFMGMRSKYLEAMDVVSSVKDTIDSQKKLGGGRNLAGDIQLQKVPLPSFNSDMRSYPKFRDDFHRYVLPRIEGNEAAAYILTSCLKGEALEKVKNVDDDIENVWKRLDEIYGDPCKLADEVMNDIKRIDPVMENDDSSLVSMIDIIERGYRDLKRMNMDGEISNSQTVSLIEERLPYTIKLKWSKRVKKDGSTICWANKFSNMMIFLLEQKRIREYANSDIRGNVQETAGMSNYVSGHRNQNADTSTGSSCLVHSSEKHVTSVCNVYCGMSPKERVELLSKHNACFSCLKPYHRSSQCWKKVKCGVEQCEKMHHESIHEAHKQGLVLRASNTDKDLEGACLLQLMRVTAASTKSSDLTVLWDSGASLCLITFRKAASLKLKGHPTQLSIVKVGGKMEQISSFAYDVPLKDLYGGVKVVKAYGIDEISSKIQQIDVSKIAPLFKGVTSEQIDRPSGNVDLLIGFNYAGLHPTREQATGNLILLGNVFGKCLGGTHPSLREKTINHVQNAIICHAVTSSSSVESFLEGENLGISCKPRCGGCACGKCVVGSRDCTLKEEEELQQIEESLKYVDGHWEVGYPWQKDPHTLLDNKIAAEAMLRSTEKRLSKDSVLAQTYAIQMKDLVDRGVAVKLTDYDIIKYIGPVHYMSHHEIMKEGNQSTPCRLVFNQSAKFKGQAINDFWSKGPDMLNNPLGIMLRFREQPCAVAGDIKKMYHSVRLKPGTDRHTHRFLWRDMDSTRRPETFMVPRVSFGDRPAGAIAAVALQKTAEMSKEAFPEAADVVLKNTYVDDILDSFEDEEVAKKITREIDELLSIGGFNTKGWVFSWKLSSKSESSQDFPPYINGPPIEQVLQHRTEILR